MTIKQTASGFFYLVGMYLGMTNYLVPALVSLGVATMILKIRPSSKRPSSL